MPIKAVIFDLDGTITQPYFNFDAIRDEIGGISGPILEEIEKMDADNQQRARKILHHHEKNAAEKATLNSGAGAMLDCLKNRGIKLGLVTRNHLPNVKTVCSNHNLSFDATVTRDDGPPKPDPFGVQKALCDLSVQSQNAMVVGDYLFDLISAKKAGAIAVLITTNPNHADFHHQADHVIDSLSELPDLIDKIEKSVET